MTAVSVKAALSAINGMTKDVESGDIYTGKVVKTTNFGAFVELMPGRDGLIHISRLAPGKQRVERVEDVVSEGDRVKVRVLDIDKQNRISPREAGGVSLERSQHRQRRSFPVA